MVRISVDVNFMNKYLKLYKHDNYYNEGTEFKEDLYVIEDVELYPYAKYIFCITSRYVLFNDMFKISNKFDIDEYTGYHQYIFGDSTSHVLFDFPDEETAFYFKLKFC